MRKGAVIAESSPATLPRRAQWVDSGIRPRMFGLALFFAWSFYCFYGPFLSDASRYVPDAPMAFSYSSSLSVLLAFPLIAALDAHHGMVRGDARAGVAAALASGLGTAMAAFGFLLPTRAQLPIAVVGGVATGFGSSWLLVAWAAFFATLAPSQRTTCALGSTFAGGIVYVAAAALPVTLQLVVACLLLPVSWLLVHRCEESADPLSTEPVGAFRELRSRTWRNVLAMFLVGVFFWVSRVMGTAGATSRERDTVVFVLGYVAIMVLVSLVVLLPRRRLANEVILRFALPTGVLGAIIVFSLDAQSNALGFSLLMSSYALMDVFLLIVVCDVSQATRCDPVKGICYARFVEGFSMPIGLALGEALGQSGLPVDEGTVALGVVFFLVVAFSALVMHDEPKGSADVVGRREVAQVTPALVFARQCEVAVRRYGLSLREAEVMLLVTRGRSIPYIAERLHIARSTAKTHMGSIYRKMDVADRQGMIDLIESLEGEGGGSADPASLTRPAGEGRMPDAQSLRTRATWAGGGPK